MNSSRPKFVYRYFSLNKLKEGDKFYVKGQETYREERIFTKNEIYFASPKQFNDPYDCRLPPISFEATDEEWHSYYKENMHEDIAKKLIEEGDHKNPDHHQYFLNNFQETIFKIGVLCFSGVPDSMLMWSHYSDGHKGFCLQFENSDIGTGKVTYSESYPKINYLRTPQDEQIEATLFTKDINWKYEEEWRIIEHQHGSGTCTFPKEKIKGVIFGAAMPDAHKSMIKNWIQSAKSSLRIYEAKKKKHTYGLDIPGINDEKI